MGKLILIRGPAGSGKSTLARKLRGMLSQGDERWSIIESDDYFMKDGVYTFIQEEHILAQDECRQRVREALAAGGNVIVANTMIRVFELRPFLLLADKLRASTQIIRCVGAYPNVHGVTDKSVREMWRRYEVHPDEKIYNEGDNTCF